MSLLERAFQLGLSADLHAIETRETDRRHRCRICGDEVPVVEDRVPMLTSAGQGARWQARPAWAHSEQCFEAMELALKAAPPIDLWDRS